MPLVQSFLEFLVNLKMYHWRTQSYPRHKASDDCFQKIQALIDQFVEVYVGRHGRKPFLSMSNECCAIHSLTDKFMPKYIQNFRNKLQRLKLRDPDLINIRDEIIGELNQCLYLFTLD
jgi:hypothetical protein